MLVIQSNRTYYVNYTDLINIALQMDIMPLKLDCHRPHLVNCIFIISIKQGRCVRGVKGGLSNELFVHPSMAPSTKFDSSFISLEKRSSFQELWSIRKSTNNQYTIEWNDVMKSTSHRCPPERGIGIREIREYCWTWPHLEKYSFSK